MEMIVPALRRVAPDLHLELHEDLRELFMRELQDHLEQIGRPGGNIVLADAKYSGDGPAEFATLRQYHTERGYNVFYADPTELYLCDDEVWYEDTRVDLLYRDYVLADFPYIGEEGDDFDHKSTFELLTDPRFSQCFTPGERQLLRRHVLWTRVLTERKTTDPTGEAIDLPEYTRANRRTEGRHLYLMRV